MYLRLGNTKINYTSPDYSDFMIYSEVVDCKMSYEKPILVHSKDELDIWFGKNFKYRNYYDELLRSGVTLFLYRPISAQTNKRQVDYTDFTTFFDEPNVYYTTEDTEFSEDIFTVKKLPERGDNKMIYKVLDDSGEYELGLGTLKYNRSIWLDEFSNYINTEDLPQYNGVNSFSVNNRDTLRLNKPGSTIQYCHPEFGRDAEGTRNYIDYRYYIWDDGEWTETEEAPGEGSRVFEVSSLSELDDILHKEPEDGDYAKVRIDYSGEIELDLDGLNLERIRKQYQTLAFSISLDNIADGQYLVLRGKVNGEYKDVIIYKGYAPADVLNLFPDNKKEVSSKEDFIKEIKNLGYRFYTVTDDWGIPEKTIMAPSFVCPVTYFHNIPTLQIDPDFDETHNILSDLSEPDKEIEFWSKSIGTDGIEADITVEIEKLGDDQYRFEISRYDYVEVYEGSLHGKEERVDYIISKNSKLVYCKVYPKEDSELPEGKWVLARAWKENYEPEHFKTGMSYLFNSNIYFDYFMIPSIQNYITARDIQDSHYRIYTTLLDMAEEKGCQVLIGNSENDYEFNYVGDRYNRLLYFYKEMYLRNGYCRPGYYIYLRGLFENVYSATTSEILYEAPLVVSRNDVYEDSDLTKSLEKKKCNYMIDNGQEYYYKCYLDGENPESTGLMRFVLDKVKRELWKHKWNYLGENMSGVVQTRIQNVLDNVLVNFSIIRSLKLGDLDLDYYNNTVTISIDTVISDLVKNHMSLDITINFSKEVWQQ